MKKMADSRKGAVRMGALLVLAACFIASALLRAGEVVAELPGGGDDGFGNPLPSAEGSGANGQHAGTSGGQGSGPKQPASVLITELQRQRAALAEREAEIAAREQNLRTLDKKLAARLEELRTARDRLAKTAALVDDAAGKDVRRLADMYQQMKPKQAGQIFNEMAPSFAAGFIAEMRPDSAALIMANMDAGKAYAVSLLIAGRNVQPAQATQAEPAVPDVRPTTPSASASQTQ